MIQIIHFNRSAEDAGNKAPSTGVNGDPGIACRDAGNPGAPGNDKGNNNEDGSTGASGNNASTTAGSA